MISPIRSGSALLIPGLVAAIPSGAVRAADYLSIPQAQLAVFPQGTTFEKHPLTLNDDQLGKIKSMSGTRQREKSPQVWKASKGGAATGWFIVDNVIGKHEFITYAAGISSSGNVLGVEILSYRESHGEEIDRKPWRDQFKGKNLSSQFKLDKDIANISGATLSCRNVTDGVKRLLALWKTALQP